MLTNLFLPPFDPPPVSLFFTPPSAPLMAAVAGFSPSIFAITPSLTAFATGPGASDSSACSFLPSAKSVSFDPRPSVSPEAFENPKSSTVLPRLLAASLRPSNGDDSCSDADGACWSVLVIAVSSQCSTDGWDGCPGQAEGGCPSDRPVVVHPASSAH